MKTGRQVIGMYRYQLITCRYCSPTSVAISLRIDLPTSSPIPFVIAIDRHCSPPMRLCSSDRVHCVYERIGRRRANRGPFQFRSPSESLVQRSDSVFDSIHSAYSTLHRNESTLFPFSSRVRPFYARYVPISPMSSPSRISISI